MTRTIDEQVAFFDYIYPRLSQRIDSLEKCNIGLNNSILRMEEERENLLLHVEQYKKKIQRVEQFLIEQGLIKLLGKKS